LNCESICAFSTKRGLQIKDSDPYSAFNINPFCGDDTEHINNCMDVFCNYLNISSNKVYLPHQIHGDEILKIDESFSEISSDEKAERLNGVDALITKLKNICICVSTADCVPILIYDTENNVIAAIHAGWRGTVARIVSKVLLTMISKYGTDASCVRAVIGPSISVDAFEVGDEVFQAFADAKFPMETIALRYPASGGAGEKWHLDLWEANRHLLLEAGVPDEQIKVSGICTYRQCEQFFSARRLGIKSGRILNGIMIKK
jgi:YfiH family protein